MDNLCTSDITQYDEKCVYNEYDLRGTGELAQVLNQLG